MNINKNISVWRGNDTPPTDYHLWIKDDGSQFLNINNKWILQSNDSNKDIINVSKLFNNYNISLDYILLLLSNYDNIPIHQGIILRFKENNLWKEYILIDSDYKLKTNWKLISVSDLLDDSEKINSNYLPSYVDDVLEFDSLLNFPTKGESGKIYIDKLLNRCYRWNGSAYILIAITSVATESYMGLMSSTDKNNFDLIKQETSFHPIININQICPNQGQGDNKDRWLITYAIEAAWNWIKSNSNRNIYLSPGLSIMFRAANVRATNGFDGPFLVFTYTSTDFSENLFKKDSNWCRVLSEADLNYELADSLYDGFLSKTDWTRFNNATSTINSHVTNFQNPHQTNKSQIGLSNVTNDALVKRSEMGVSNGVATLDSSGKVVTSLLPSFVDDVLEFESKTAFPATGESGKIYMSLDTNLTYRWGGTEYVEISKSLALGETSSTAYAGNKGKDTTDKLNTHLENYNNPHQVTKEQVGLGNVDNTSDLNKPISTATQSALDGKVDKVSGKGLSSEDYTKAEKDKLAGIEAGAQVNTVIGVKGNSESSYRTGNINITPTNIGLGNVDNTSDLNKPVSTAQQTALNKKVDKTYLDEQLETKANKADVDKQRISYVSPCFADCTETHEAKLKSITLAASIIPSKAIFSITLKIANNLTLLNQSPVYMHLVDISGNVIGVSQNAVKQVQNKGKYVTWFFDSVINTTGALFVIKLHTTNSASNANDSNFVDIIAHVSQDGGVEGIGVTSDDGTYHTDWTPAIGINVVNPAAIYPQIKELQKLCMAYATSELPDISTTGHEADINEIRISQTTMGISLVSSVSLMVASDNAYDGEVLLLVLDTNDNFVAMSNNAVNLSQSLGEYVTWYFPPFPLTDDTIYRFIAFNGSGNIQAMHIHVALDKNEGVTCLDQNNSPHTDYCPALGVNVSAIVTNDLYKNIDNINSKIENLDSTTDMLSTNITKLNNTTDRLSTKMINVEAKLNNAFIGLEETLAYGVEWDTEVADPHLTRIGNMSFHKTLPIQSQLKGCIAQKDKVIYWLNESDWRFKKNPETVSIGLTVDGGYSLVSDIFSTLRYEKQWVKIGGVACQIGSINTDTNTATLVTNDQLDALGLITGTQNVELGAVLNGYDGTVRVYCPSFYIKSEIDGTKRRVWISTAKTDNSYTYQPEILIDAYRSTILNTVPSNMGYLSTLRARSIISVVNTHDYCRGGDGTRSANDAYLETDPFRSDLCKPITNLARFNMRNLVRWNGSEILSYDLYKNIFYWLYVIEYANFNCQEAYKEALTDEGYKQGGLGAGITNMGNWGEYNGNYPLTPCGYGNEIGNGTGIKPLVIPEFTYGSGSIRTALTLSMPRWRGFDNPFGDIWTNLDGIIIQGDAAGNPKTVYTTTDPNNYGDSELAKKAMKIAGHWIPHNGHIKEFDLGEAAHIIPESIGGDITKYKCDYHLTYYKDTEIRMLLVGGSANNGANAGLGCFNSTYYTNLVSYSVGFRSVSRFVSFSE